jgi:hypothetical protein
MGCIGVYFLLKAVYHGVIEFIGDELLSITVYMFTQATDFLLLGGLLLIFYSREWPPYFLLSLTEISGVRNNNHVEPP